MKTVRLNRVISAGKHPGLLPSKYHLCATNRGDVWQEHSQQEVPEDIRTDLVRYIGGNGKTFFAGYWDYDSFN